MNTDVHRSKLHCSTIHYAKIHYAKIVAFFYLLLCSVTAANAAQGWQAPEFLDGATTVSAQEALDLKTEFPNVVTLDSRPPNQRSVATLPGAVAISDSRFTPDQIAALAPDKFTPILIFCDSIASGYSYRAANKLVSWGYARVFWLRGGLREWLDAGLPVVAVTQ